MDSIHETHLDTNEGGTEVPKAKGLFNSEQKRLKEEDKIAENLRKVLTDSRGAVACMADKMCSNGNDTMTY